MTGNSPPLITVAETVAASKLAPERQSQKRQRSATEALYYYLGFSPIYPREKERNSEGRARYWGKRDDEATACRDGKNLWATIPLPAVLGRRNLVETWWNRCPCTRCQAHERCHDPGNVSQTTKSLAVCCHCRPLLDPRHVLALSKAMLHVSQDGTVTITAKHRQLVRFLPEKGLPTNYPFAPKPIGTLSIGTMSSKTTHKSEGLACSSPTDGVWMKFKLRLQSLHEAPDTDVPENIHIGQHEQASMWHLATAEKVAKRRQRDVFPNRHRRRRRVFLAQSDSSSEEEDTRMMLQEPRLSVARREWQSELKSPPEDLDHAPEAQRKLVFGTNTQEVGSGKADPPGSIPGGQETMAAELVTGPVKDGDTHTSDSPVTLQNGGGGMSRWKLREQVHNENTTATATTLNEHAHKRRRLAELEELAVSAVESQLVNEQPKHDGTPRRLKFQGTGTQPAPCNSPPDESLSPPNVAKTQHPMLSKMAPQGSCGGGMLSMPDDRLQTESASPSRPMLMKEVGTQKGQRKCSGVAVRDLSLDEWTQMLALSQPGSLPHALSDLVVTKNKPSGVEKRGDVRPWLPPVLDPNTRLESIK